MRSKPVIAGLLAFFAYSLLLSAYGTMKYHGNPTGFILVDKDHEALVRQVYSKQLEVRDAGYDGQYFFLMATDPLARSARADRFDLPAYRYGRIGYPALCYLLSAGSRQALPWVMLLVNAASVSLGCFVAVRWALAKGCPWWLGLAFPAIPGVLIATMRDLPEPMACLLLFVGLHGLLEDKPWKAYPFLALAVITRETYYLPLLALCVHGIITRRRPRWVALALVPAPYLFWQAYVYYRFGDFSFSTVTTGFARPVAGLVSKYVDSLAVMGGPSGDKLQAGLDLFLLSMLLVGAFMAVTVAFSGLNSGAEALWGVGILFAALLFTSPFVLEGYWSFLRVHALFPLLCLAFAISSKRRGWLYPLLSFEVGTVVICCSFFVKKVLAVFA